jgi:hypothetical protein
MITHKNEKHSSQVERNTTVVNHLDLGHIIPRLMLHGQEEEDHNSSRHSQHGNQPEDPSPGQLLDQRAAEKGSRPVGQRGNGAEDTCVLIAISFHYYHTAILKPYTASAKKSIIP